MEYICYVQANVNDKSSSVVYFHRSECKNHPRSGYGLHVLILSINAIEESKTFGYACWNTRAIKSFFCQNESREKMATIFALCIINFSEHAFAICRNDQVCNLSLEAEDLARGQAILHSNFQSDHSSKPFPKIMCPNNGQQLKVESVTRIGKNKIKIMSNISRICWKWFDFLNSSSFFSLNMQCSVFFNAEVFRRVHFLCTCKGLIVCKTSQLLVVSVDYREMKGCIIAKPMFELKVSTFQIEITLYNMLLEFNSCFNRARKMHRIYLLKQLLKITDEEHISKIAKNLQSKENIQIPNKNENKHYSSAHKTDIYHLWKKAKFKNSVMTKTIAFFQNHEPDCLNDSETLGERKHKEWLSCDFEKFSEISIFPVFRRNDLEYSFQQILNGTPYLSSEVMRFEHHRLSSFANYNSSDTPSVLVMAKAGWYATGNGRETKTFCCMISNSAWKKEDDPFHVHKELYYDCAFILGTDLDQVSIQKENPECQRKNSDANNSNISEISTNVQNMRIVSSKSNLAEKLEESHMGNQSEIEKFSELSSKSTQNTSTTWSIDCPSRPSSASRRGDSFPRDVSIDRNRRAQKSGLNEVASYQNDNDKRKIEFSDSDDGSTHIFREPILPPLDFEKPKHIEYSTVGIRASSFSGFPISSRKTPKEFAVGGFYYRGFGDRTTCFHCGISLQGWSVEDDVFVEHVRYNPLCQYMRRLKGDEFIKLVMAATHNLQTITSLSGTRGDETSSQNSSAKDIASTLKEMGFSQSAISVALGRVATKNDRLTIQGILDVIVENTDIVQRNSANNRSTSTANEENGENLNSQESLANTRLSGSTTTGFSTDLSSASKSELELKDQFICKICMDERVGVVFTPCGHIVTCSKCSKSLKKCPICRENIRDKVRTVITD